MKRTQSHPKTKPARSRAGGSLAPTPVGAIRELLGAFARPYEAALESLRVQLAHAAAALDAERACAHQRDRQSHEDRVRLARDVDTANEDRRALRSELESAAARHAEEIRALRARHRDEILALQGASAPRNHPGESPRADA